MAKRVSLNDWATNQPSKQKRQNTIKSQHSDWGFGFTNSHSCSSLNGTREGYWKAAWMHTCVGAWVRGCLAGILNNTSIFYSWWYNHTHWNVMNSNSKSKRKAHIPCKEWYWWELERLKGGVLHTDNVYVFMYFLFPYSITISNATPSSGTLTRRTLRCLSSFFCREWSKTTDYLPFII